MNICLVSEDETLYELCRDIVASQTAGECRLIQASVGGTPPDASLYIWDFDPDRAEPGRDYREERNTNIFLVQRRRLSAFVRRFPLATGATVIKPPNRATLQTLIEHAVAAHYARVAGARPSEGQCRTCRDDLLQALFHAHLKLQEYDQDRTSFLARVTHDFRVPLTAIGGYCGLLQAEQIGPLNAAQLDVLRRMRYSINRLSRMSTALFQLSDSRFTERVPDFREADLAVSVDHAADEVAPLVADKHIALTVDLEKPARLMFFEPSQIEQVLANLLENACKFTPHDGAIAVRGYPTFWERRSAGASRSHKQERRKRESRAPNAYRVDVSDSGPGLDPSVLEQVFQEHVPPGSDRDRACGGLGLAICRMIVTLHRGRIWAEPSLAGAKLSFVLPMGRPDQVTQIDGDARKPASAPPLETSVRGGYHYAASR